jgi:hypothetical protein
MTLHSAFITTVRHNVGDDFVRGGIQSLLAEAVRSAAPEAQAEIKSLLIHKHSPITAVRGCSRIRSTRLSKLLDPLARRLHLPDAISSADLLVQSGAPIYWHHPGHSSCETNEWYEPLILKRYACLKRPIPLLNLAGGSCQRFHSDGSEFQTSPAALDYIDDFFRRCSLTTLRDPLAQRILALAGHKAEVLPCTSIFARDHHTIEPRQGQTIVLNFMQHGGHYTFGQSIDSNAWQHRFAALAAAAQEIGPVVLACHNATEAALAAELFPSYERFLVPNDPVAFMQFYAGARFGIVNRVHAGFMLASLGKPVAVIGSDSRARMIELLDLPAYFVNDVPDPQALLADLQDREGDYKLRIEAIRSTARARYLELLQPVLAPLLKL